MLADRHVDRFCGILRSAPVSFTGSSPGLALNCKSGRANRDVSIVISDPNDPKFDLEAYLTMKMADETK